MKDMLAHQDVFKSDEDTDSDEYTKHEDPNLPCFGTRVRRGADWKWKNQDSEGPGTIVGHGKRGNSLNMMQGGL